MNLSAVRRSIGARFLLLMAALVLAALSAVGSNRAPAQLRGVLMHPNVSDYVQVSASETPPTEAQCFSVGRRCFTPQSTRAAYDLAPLYSQGIDGTGTTIALVDSYGNDNMAHDLHVYDQAFGLPPLCGEQDVTCAPGMPWFHTFHVQGAPATKAPPSTSKAPGQEAKSAWALETSLDVETAHAMAPGANILLVTTPTAETLGVQGFPDMMNAEQYVVDHHLADVISQSFGSAEDAFASAQALLTLRHAYVSAAENGVTVLASSGDFGSAGTSKQPVGQGGALLPDPTVGWPASDPLVTGVGGTYLCTDPLATTVRTVDSVDPPTNCQSNPGQAEVGWIDAGGGYSHVFSRPAYQDSLPAGSTPIPSSARGVPDIGLQASARTGALIYVSLPPAGGSGLICGSAPCSTGWYDIGGTSLSCPQWAGIVALADQLNGGGLGPINPALYSLANNAADYATDFFDVTVGNNQAFPDVPGYSASAGWDPVTGLGTPDVANLVPALVHAVNSP
jgi:subtilase family serine protease